MRRCKKFRAAESPGDSFSIFPNDVVSHILSFLPTKDAVRTSVLSQNWLYRWTSIHDIDVDDKHKSLRGDDRKSNFLNFMSRILLRTRNSGIRRFRLRCYKLYHPSYFETWISEALMRNVENLEISAPTAQVIDSGWCFSGWTSLTELYLSLTSTLTVPANTCFFNLKKLCLVGCYYGRIKIKTRDTPNNTTGRIILTFPVLELLTLQSCEWMDVNFVEIHAPELITIRICYLNELKNHEIKIFAAKLATFESCSGFIYNFVLSAPVTSSLVLAHSVTEQTLVLRTYKLLKQFHDLTCLKLRGDVLEAIVQLKSRFVIPVFDRLKELHAYYSCDIKDIFELLQVLPSLEVLKFCPTDDCETKMEALSPNIVSNLKKVELGFFNESKGHMDLAKYILENARNLKELVIAINSRSPTTVRRLLSKLMPETSSCVLVTNDTTRMNMWTFSA